MLFLFPKLPKVIGNTHLTQAITTAKIYGDEVPPLFLKIILILGSEDCKNNLMGILDAFEFLLSQNFEPKRTILAGFGFDEEISFTHLCS